MFGKTMLAVFFSVVLFVVLSSVSFAQGPYCAPPAYTGNAWSDAVEQARYNACMNSYYAEQTAKNYVSAQASDWNQQWNQGIANAQSWGQQVYQGARQTQNVYQRGGYFSCTRWQQQWNGSAWVTVCVQ